MNLPSGAEAPGSAAAENVGAEAGVLQSTTIRRRIVVALGVVAVLLLLAVLPPLINVSRMQRTIAASMSASLGRPVHLDNVHLHVLPVPGFTIENLVVSDDPAFGNEPIIRANLVDVRLRPSSLWRRQVEVSSIHFKVDEHGAGPSVNLVRRADGRWNLQGLLHSAARVAAAPTAQTAVSAAPRFPYIEATGARLNLKLGQEKTPFSLTDADVALWLPDADRWQVRLEGRPERTDTNISDAGTVKLEGSLGRSPAGTGIPVDLKASWSRAQLGEASKLLTGRDMGWRGEVAVDATLTGALSGTPPVPDAARMAGAVLTVKLHLEDLRRADFVPAKTLVVDVTCAGAVDLAASALVDTRCLLRTPTGAKGAGKLELAARTIPLGGGSADGLALNVLATNVDDAWLVDWARLFSRRVPPEERPAGVLDGTLGLTVTPDAMAVDQADLRSSIEGELPSEPAAKTTSAGLTERALVIARDGDGLALQEFPLLSTGKEGLALGGTLNPQGYTLRLQGVATAAQMKDVIAMAPPLGDGVMEAVTAGPTASALNVTCTRMWGGPQTCAAVATVKVPKKRRR